MGDRQEQNLLDNPCRVKAIPCGIRTEWVLEGTAITLSDQYVSDPRVTQRVIETVADNLREKQYSPAYANLSTDNLDLAEGWEEHQQSRFRHWVAGAQQPYWIKTDPDKRDVLFCLSTI